MPNIADSFTKLLDEPFPLRAFEERTRRRALAPHIVGLEVDVADLRIILLSSNIDASRIDANQEWTRILDEYLDITCVDYAMNDAFPLYERKRCQLRLDDLMVPVLGPGASSHREVRGDA